MEQESRRRREFVIDGGDLEYEFDTRAEAQPSSYQGGMADIIHSGRDRAAFRPAQSQVAVLGKSSKPYCPDL